MVKYLLTGAFSYYKKNRAYDLIALCIITHMKFYIYSFCFSLIFNFLMFVIAYIRQTDTLTDISYSLTFLALALYLFIQSDRSLNKAIVMFCVVIWSLRLGSYLLMRIRRMMFDKRFDNLRSSFWKFGGFWLIQAITVFVVMLNSIVYSQAKSSGKILYMAPGLIIFAVGLALEAVADYQKNKFVVDPRNKGKWIESGVWGYSRHPNYLGEMLVWVGLYAATFSNLTGSHRLFAALSPLYIIGLLMFVSGVPIIEKSADKKWGSDPGYQKYKKKVPKML
jgi:steroid 5-alpha reductase family enzyme